MAVVRQAGVLLLAALLTSRGLFAQDPVDSATAPAPLPSLPAGAAATVPVDQLKVLLRPTEIRYVQQESVLLPPTANIKALYVADLRNCGSSCAWLMRPRSTPS